MSKTKLVIIEGCDRVGKDTLVKGLLARHSNSQTHHWGYPQGSTNEEKTRFQQEDFKAQMLNWKNSYLQQNVDLLIWNRSHLGEYVYGTLYRDSQPQTWVPQLEQEFLENSTDVYLIMLIADPHFIAKADDGNSYSNRLEDKIAEMQKFMEAFQKTRIVNKKLLQVHQEDQYLPATDILNHVLHFINYA